MPLRSYFDLFNGLQALCRQSDDCCQQLQTRLSQGQSISASDEQWLDGPANLTDKTLLMDKLGEASDFQQALDALSLPEKNIVRQLQRLVQDKSARIDMLLTGTKKKGVLAAILS